jgi:hypothetical protein
MDLNPTEIVESTECLTQRLAEIANVNLALRALDHNTRSSPGGSNVCMCNESVRSTKIKKQIRSIHGRVSWLYKYNVQSGCPVADHGDPSLEQQVIALFTQWHSLSFDSWQSLAEFTQARQKLNGKTA